MSSVVNWWESIVVVCPLGCFPDDEPTVASLLNVQAGVLSHCSTLLPGCRACLGTTSCIVKQFAVLDFFLTKVCTGCTTHASFFEIALVHVLVCVGVRVCVSSPVYDWLNKFCIFSLLQLLYITLAVDKMDGRGLINTACHEHLPKKTMVTWY